MKKLSIIFFILLSVCLSTALQAGEKTINLIWQINTDVFYEVDWLKELLSDLNYKEVLDGEYKTVLNNSIVVISLHENNNRMDYFEQFDKKKYKYGIIHVNDELYSHPTDCYKKAKFVFRNYWHKNFLKQKHVYAFPIGYKRGFWNNYPFKQINDASHRDYVWSFAGQITQKPTRETMIANMKNVPNHYIYETFAWADPNSLTTEDYRNLLLNTIFVPCPTGFWNLDSFRLSETLECGCIPIVEKKPFDYFTKLYGNHPFISVDSWDQAPALINELLADPVRLEYRRQKCYNWWLEHKKSLKAKIARLCIEKLG